MSQNRLSPSEFEQISWAALEQGMVDLVFLLDSEGRFLRHWCSDPALLFLPPEQFLNKTMAEVSPPEFQAQIGPLFEQAARGKYPPPLEYHSSDGKTWFSASLTPLVGWPGYVLCKVRDITVKKHRLKQLEQEVTLRTAALTQAIQELRQAETILNASQELSQIGGWEYHLEKQTMWWSNELYRIHGLPVDRSSLDVQTRVSESLNCYAPSAREELQSLFPKAFQGEGYERVYAFRSYDGQDKWVHLITTPVWENGKITRVYGIVADISKRRQAELERERTISALQNSQIRLETAQKLALIGDWELDHRTGQAHWSEMVYQIFEVDPQQFTPSLERFLDCVHPEDRDGVAAAFRASVETRSPYDIVHRLAFPDGRIKYIHEIGNTNYNAEQEPLLTHGSVQDITRLKETEWALIEAKATAEKASRSKSLFLANMSHEIRTPMNAILGFSQLLKSEIEDPRWKRYLKIIHSSGESLLNLINDILDISKIEAGKLELHPQPVALIPLLRELYELLGPDFDKKQLQFDLEIDPQLPEWVLLDGLRLRQILLNLLSNALKFTRQGSVRLSLNSHFIRPEAGELVFEVSDTGICIAPELQKRIFEVFEQANLSYRKEVAGTGLGLSISHQLALLMGGDLTVESQVNQGSVFRLTLPFAVSGQAPQNPESPPEPTEIRPARLLIADDASENLLLLAALLEAFPLQIYTAANGQEACELAEKYHPDLILMDIKMPIMDGTEALQRLRQNPLTQTLPVVALTAFSLQNEQENLLEMGFDGYLSKPVRRESLLQMLKRFLARPCEDAVPPETPLEESAIPPIAQATVLPLTDTEITERSQAILSHWLPQAESLRQNMVINEMEDFALALAPWAQKWQWPTLQSLCQALQAQLAAFELEAAQHSLAQISEALQTQLPGKTP